MPRTARMVYVPLDVEFFDNARILEAGEKAAWLYVAMLCRAKRLQSDGVLTRQQMERLQITGWKVRVTKLIETGLVTLLDDGRYLIVGFLERNPSAQALTEYRRKDADRKRSESHGNPDGIRTESGAEVEVKRREEKGRRSDVTSTTHQALRLVEQVSA